jgi:hypothetical protein
MDNPEKLATLGTQDTRPQQAKQQQKHSTENKNRLVTRTPPKTGGEQ